MNIHKHHWLTKLVPTLAFAAGIIMASIGAVMVISSSLKLALFDSEPYSYITKDDCRYDYTKPLNSEGIAPERSASEIETCLKDRRHEELVRFQNTEKRDIVDGVSALLVGGILVLLFRHRKNK